MANGRCRMHGGKSPVGIASPSFKHGRYSRALGVAAPVLESYLEQRAAGETSSLADEMALLRARANELLQNLEHRESGELWKSVGKAFGALTGAMAQKDRETVSAQLSTLRELIEQGANPYSIWREVTSHLGLIGKLARTELQRETRQQETMTAREAAVFKSIVETNLKEALERNCDPELARRVLTDFVGGVGRDIARQRSARPNAVLHDGDA